MAEEYRMFGIPVTPPATCDPTVLATEDQLMDALELTYGTGAEGIFMASIFLQNVAGVLASLAELELELGPERRTAARDARRARGQSIGRPKALTNEKAALWRGGCTTAESRPAPSQPRLTSAAPPSIAR
jgi:hypothetical protein